MFTMDTNLGVTTGMRSLTKKYFSSLTTTYFTKTLIFPFFQIDLGVHTTRLAGRLLNLLSILPHQFFLLLLHFKVACYCNSRRAGSCHSPPKVPLPLVLDIFSAEVRVMMFTLAPSIPRMLHIHLGQRKWRRAPKSNIWMCEDESCDSLEMNTDQRK